jgi:hypothetical protein
VRSVDFMKIKRALVSVSDKTGVVEFARKLHAAGVEIVSTGGTMRAIKEAGIPVMYVSDVTGFPEIMDGRVKTLNPYIHGGILAVRDNPEHVASMREHKITPIDLVVVNLYPFKETIAKPDVTLAEAIENIDIVHGVNFQPVAFAGRTPSDQVEEQRITIPDFLKLVEDQTGGQISKDDFYSATSVQPVSEFIGALRNEEPPVTLNCHQHCGSATYIFMDEGKIIPITRFIDIDKFLAFLNKYTEKLESGSFAIKSRIFASAAKNFNKIFKEEEAPAGLDMKKIIFDIFKDQSYDALGEFHVNSLLISCMHFMDPFNFDTDRVKDCVIHYAVPDGRVIPFCTMNSIYRQGIEDEFSVPLTQKMTEFNDKTGKEEEDED